MIETLPSVLVSYAYRKSWEAARHLRFWRDVVFDSGAYTAWTQGVTIDIHAFADWILHEQSLAATGEAAPVIEVFALDVIGDWRTTERNTLELLKLGINAIPTFHVGEPTGVLRGYVRDYEKVALGGAVGYAHKMDWAALCFREAWAQGSGPVKLHGLGFGPAALERLPFHSIDFSSWNVGALKFGNYQSFGGAHLGRPRAGDYALPSEVAHQLKLEGEARRFWAGRIPTSWGSAPSIRLVAGDGAAVAALGPPGTRPPRRRS